MVGLNTAREPASVSEAESAGLVKTRVDGGIVTGHLSRRQAFTVLHALISRPVLPPVEFFLLRRTIPRLSPEGAVIRMSQTVGKVHNPEPAINLPLTLSPDPSGLQPRLALCRCRLRLALARPHRLADRRRAHGQAQTHLGPLDRLR